MASADLCPSDLRERFRQVLGEGLHGVRVRSALLDAYNSGMRDPYDLMGEVLDGVADEITSEERFNPASPLAYEAAVRLLFLHERASGISSTGTGRDPMPYR